MDVELSFDEAVVRLCVRDDGRGMPRPEGTRPQPRSDGIGLAGMRERAGEIGAQLSLTSQAGQGTRLEVTWGFP